MKKSIFHYFIVAVFVISASLPAHFTPSACAGSVEQAEQLVNLLQLETQLVETIDASIKSAGSKLLRRGYPATTVQNITALVRSDLMDSLPNLMNGITNIYAEEFTDAELEDLIRFYKTPTGQKFVSMRSKLSSRQSSALRTWFDNVRTRTLSLIEAQV